MLGSNDAHVGDLHVEDGVVGAVRMAPGLEVDIISAEDLILAKLQWALQGESEFQLRDVRNLMRSVPGLDQPYLREWAAKTGVGDLLTKASTP